MNKSKYVNHTNERMWQAVHTVQEAREQIPLTAESVREDQRKACSCSTRIRDRAPPIYLTVISLCIS